MKKRIRKKRGRGEFTDYGVWVLLRLPEDADPELNERLSGEFLDFILEHGMRGSMGARPHLKGLVFMNWRRSVVTHWMLEFIREWIGQHPEIASHEISDPVDARREGWPDHWPAYERDDVVRFLAHWVAWDTFGWHRKHPGHSVFDAAREEGMNPLAWDVRTTEPPGPQE